MTIKEKKHKIGILCKKLEREPCLENRYVLINKIRALQGEVIASYDLLTRKLAQTIMTTDNFYATNKTSIYKQNEPSMFKIDNSELFEYYKKIIGE